MSDGVGADQPAQPGGGKLHISRSRGALSGLLLILAGAWGALVPFLGPYFDFAFTPRPDASWHWTAARGWYEVLPGGLAVFGGLLLLASRSRLTTIFGAWIAALAGGWFVVAPTMSQVLTLGSIGHPVSPGVVKSTVEALTFFSGIGAVIVLIAAIAIGRLSVRSVRDVEAAARRTAQAQGVERQEAEPVEAEQHEADRPAAEAGGWPAQQGGASRPMPTQGQHEPRVSAGGPAPVGSPEPVATTQDPGGAYAPGGATPVPADMDDALPQPVPGGAAPEPAADVPTPAADDPEPAADDAAIADATPAPNDGEPASAETEPVEPAEADMQPARRRPTGYGKRVPTLYERRRSSTGD